MRINPINSNFYVPNLNQKKTEPVISPIETANVPMSKLYPKPLLSFKSNPKDMIQKVFEAPIGDKISVAIKKSNRNNFFVGNSVRAIQDLLIVTQNEIKRPIRNINCLIDPRIQELLGIHQLSDDEFLIYNYSSQNVRINGTEVIPSAESFNACLGDRIKISGKWVELTTEIKDKELEDASSLFFKQYDFSKTIDSTIRNLNRKIVESLLKQDTTKKGTTFADIGGQDKVIKSLRQNLLFPLKYPEVYEGFMSSMGAILYGIPGTGKSYIAEAFANEANASVFEMCATDLAAKYVGESEKNCRELFQKAIDAQPSVIIIDEFDALGRARSGEDVHGAKLLNQFLACTSNIQKNNDKVVILGMTNLLESVDKAILRSGRFDHHYEILPPDLEGSIKILELKTKGKPLDKEVNIKDLATKMHSKKMTGADITAMVRNAHGNALERTGVLKSMEEDRFTPEMLDYFSIKTEDFEKAIADFKSDSTKRRAIGY